MAETTVEREVREITEDLKVIKEDPNSLAIIQAVVQAMAARCRMDEKKGA